MKTQSRNWKQHIHDIAITLNRVNAFFITIRNFLNKHILRTNYFAIFDPHINYTNLIWGQNLTVVNRILVLQWKAFIIMDFQSRDSYAHPFLNPTILLNLKTKYL